MSTKFNRSRFSIPSFSFDRRPFGITGVGLFFAMSASLLVAGQAIAGGPSLARTSAAAEVSHRAGNIALAASSNVARHYERALRHLERGEYRAAIPLLISVIEAEPEHSQAWFQIGKALVAIQDYELASQSLIVHIVNGAQGTDAAEAWYLIGVCKDRLGQLEDSLEALTIAVRINPRHANAWQLLGAQHLVRGDWSKATEAFRTVVELQPDNNIARKGLGLSYMQQYMWAEAAQEMSEVLRRDANDAIANLSLGICYAMLGDRTRARAQYDRLLKIDPDKAAQLLKVIES